MFFWVMYAILWLPRVIFLPFKVINKKNMDRKKTYIIAGNHQSVYDPVLLDYAFRKRNIFLAKHELFKSSFNRFFLGKVFGAIPVDREKGLTLSQTKQIFGILKANKDNLGIFPEGTRRDELNQEDEIKGGVSMFAIKAKKPILPVYIITNKLCHKRTVIVGKPFELTDFYNKKLDKDTLLEADNVLKSKILELKTNYDKVLKEKVLVKQLKHQKRLKKAQIKENI